MLTVFSGRQLQNPRIRHIDQLVRPCVHCGICTASCPTYQLTGDELDSPRGRIYLIKTLAESEAVPGTAARAHLDRCLGCLACMTACPSNVDYRHIIDEGRQIMDERIRRPMGDRLMRKGLKTVLSRPFLLKAGLRLIRLAAPGLRAVTSRFPDRTWSELIDHGCRAAALVPQSGSEPDPEAAENSGCRRHVALFGGCVQSVLSPQTNASIRRILGRSGELAVPMSGEVCCGALAAHLGFEREAIALARRNVAVWHRALSEKRISALVVAATGCASMISDYPDLLHEDVTWREKAKTVAAKLVDACAYLNAIDIPFSNPAKGRKVSFHPPCSQQHGLRVIQAPIELLTKAEFDVSLPEHAATCCGSAGVYSILQPKIAGTLARRKVEALKKSGPDYIATANIGCQSHLSAHMKGDVVHVVELVDWASGGASPRMEAIHFEN